MLYKNLANNITSFFVKKNVIAESKKNVYSYGFEIILSTIVYEAIFLVLALITKTFFPSLLFWIGFFFIRKCCGGYHAHTYFACHIMFAANHLAFIFLLKMFLKSTDPRIAAVIVFVCAGIILLIAPVAHPNKPFIKNEYNNFKKKSRIYACVLIAISIIGLLPFMTYHAAYWGYTIGTLSATISLLSAKIIYKPERNSTHEKIDAKID